MRLLVLDDYEGELARAPSMAQLSQLADVTIWNHPLRPDDLTTLEQYQAILALRERSALDRRFFEHSPNTEIVLQTGGHAYHVDQEAATRNGTIIALGRRVTRPTAAVPELVFGMMLELNRHVAALSASMHLGGWPMAMGRTLAGQSLGILGYGRLGRVVGGLAEAFGMNVLAWDRREASALADNSGRRVPLDDLLSQADVVSIHLRLSDESRGLLNRQRLRSMKRNAILINTARGAIVDEEALIEALREGWIRGAALDVFSQEPLAASSPLRHMPNVLLTPHIGWKTEEVLHEFVKIAAEQLDDWLNHRLSSKEVLNPRALSVTRARRGGLKQEAELGL
jgi:D-3-phosphoglycerate dehydrogenase